MHCHIIYDGGLDKFNRVSAVIYYGPFPKAALPLGLTHCVLVDSSTVICWTRPFVILGVSGLFFRFYSFLMENLDVASDLGLHCLPIALLRVSR